MSVCFCVCLIVVVVVVVVVVVYVFNEDKVMGIHIWSIPAIDTWCIQLHALLPDKPVNEPALFHTLLGHSVRCSSPVCIYESCRDVYSGRT